MNTPDHHDEDGYDTREYNSKETTILGRVCEKLKALGIPVSVGVALRYRGLGRKRLQTLIKMGYVTGSLHDPQERAAYNAERAAESKKRRNKARTAKVRQMITDTESRLKALRQELRALTK